MGVMAFVLITVRHGIIEKVAEQLMKFKEVTEVHRLYGQFDIIIKVEAQDMKILEKFIYKNVRPISGVESTETLISSDVV